MYYFFVYTGARAIISSNSEYPIATGPILLDNVQCEGDEDYLINCTSLGFRQHDCTHLEDAGVECQSKTWVEWSGAIG